MDNLEFIFSDTRYNAIPVDDSGDESYYVYTESNEWICNVFSITTRFGTDWIGVYKDNRQNTFSEVLANNTNIRAINNAILMVAVGVIAK